MKAPKLLLLLASMGLLVSCGGGQAGGQSEGPHSEPSSEQEGGSESESQEELSNQINVIYFKNYVSANRANEIKAGFIASLQAASVSVDAEKVNFFESRNTTVAALGEEILDYNDQNPSNQIDVILGANGFSKFEEGDPTLYAQFVAKYENDGMNYTYGTHTNVANNSNRKFFYDKAKAQDTYVKGLQNYLQANWTEQEGGDSEETSEEEVATGVLTVFVYSVYVSEARMNAMKTGFISYLSTNGLAAIPNLTFEFEQETSSIPDFMGKVADYNNEHPNAKVDALLGLKSNTAITNAGFSNDGNAYNYGTKEGSEADRKFWYKTDSPNIAEIHKLQAYLQANWLTPAA